MRISPLRLPLLLVAAAACAGPPDDAPSAGASAASEPQRPAARNAAAPREGALFAMDAQEGGRYVLDPVAIVTPAGLRDPWEVEEDSVFHARYFAPGTRYAVRAAGVPVGEVRVTEVAEPACSERVAEGAFTASGRLPAGWEGGLASDAFPTPAAEPLVRPLTPREQGELATLADSIHASHRIPSAARAAGENERLFAVTVAGAGAPVLVGTFNVTVPADETSSTYNLMLAAEARGGGAYRPAYVHHERDDGETGVRSLLDATDLDGDGVPELVVRLMFNEGWGYAVLARGPGGWREVYQGGGGGGC
ncbi:MAG: hypothetical protein KY467_08830 [Gemmatimonadetes bacterium]|nr:hypothetical protein [Gemmatimonadota bacterium]